MENIYYSRHLSPGKEIVDRVPKSQLLLETNSPFTIGDSQRQSLNIIYTFLDPENTGFLWQNFERLLRDFSMYK